MSDLLRHDIRNVAIIAHVDHGKTTLVDGMLKQSRIFRDNQQVGSLIMDSNELERERGITILAKNTAVSYRGVKINIIDTPGHADFGSEVERVLQMADGCLLLVDAVEGPMPQTRYVLRKALELGLRPIVVINKVDRPFARPAEVLSQTQDLFLEVATDAEQLDFPVVYAIAKEGTAGLAPDALAADLEPLFDTILSHVPPPPGDAEAPFQILVAALDYDNHLGRIAIGRLVRGTLLVGCPVIRLGRDGQPIATATPLRLKQLFIYDGLRKREVDRVEAGEIVVVIGLDESAIGETLADPAAPEALPSMAVDEPTVRITLGVNTSPFAGREGKYQTSRQIRARLARELEVNVGLRVEDTESADRFLVSGRGELHLSILVETMRREGFEFEVSRPEVITHVVDGVLTEPVEELVIDTIEDYVGAATELVGPRLARLVNLRHSETPGGTQVRLEYQIPTRGLIGLRNQLLTATRGNATMSSVFLSYQPWLGAIGSTRSGALIATEMGTAVSYGLAAAQERGMLFIDPGLEVYEGMVVGQSPRSMDVPVNVCRQKKATNVRASTSDIAVRLTPPRHLSLEESLDFLEPDELLEVTPKGLRLRKRLLKADDRAKFKKSEAKFGAPVGAR